jgi:hypothetical protein
MNRNILLSGKYKSFLQLVVESGCERKVFYLDMRRFVMFSDLRAKAVYSVEGFSFRDHCIIIFVY